MGDAQRVDALGRRAPGARAELRARSERLFLVRVAARCARLTERASGGQVFEFQIEVACNGPFRLARTTLLPQSPYLLMSRAGK